MTQNVHTSGRRGPSTRTRTSIAIALGVGFLILVGVAVATPSEGVVSAPVHARGTLGEDQLVNSKSGVHVKTKGSADLVSQQIIIAGGGHTGWHSHPGPVLVTVKRGALRLIYANDRRCTGTVYQEGDSFIDRGDAVVHIARNESLMNEVELWATYFVPGVPGADFRLNEPAGSRC
jgi:quercetin dioxygenase-like cupin family protein